MAFFSLSVKQMFFNPHTQNVISFFHYREIPDACHQEILCETNPMLIFSKGLIGYKDLALIIWRLYIYILLLCNSVVEENDRSRFSKEVVPL